MNNGSDGLTARALGGLHVYQCTCIVQQLSSEYFHQLAVEVHPNDSANGIVRSEFLQMKGSKFLDF